MEHHQHFDPKAGNARIFWAVAINLLLTIVQIIGGSLSGSLALIADAIHNLSDALSLVLVFVARKIAQRPADESMNIRAAFSAQRCRRSWPCCGHCRGHGDHFV